MTSQSRILNREDLRDDISSLASNTSVENVITAKDKEGQKTTKSFFTNILKSGIPKSSTKMPCSSTMSKDEQIKQLMEIVKRKEEEKQELTELLNEYQEEDKRIPKKTNYQDKPIVSGFNNNFDITDDRPLVSWESQNNLDTAASKPKSSYKPPMPTIIQRSQYRSLSPTYEPQMMVPNNYQYMPPHSNNNHDEGDLGALKRARRNALFNYRGRPEDDLQTWIYTMETYLEHFHFNDHEKKLVASAYLKENALQKYICHPRKNNLSWRELKDMLTESFQSMNYQHTLRIKLTNLKQTGTLEHYIQDFERIISQLNSRADEFFLSIFISGLKPNIGRQVSMHSPPNYEEAKTMALMINESYQAFPNTKPFNNSYGKNNSYGGNNRMTDRNNGNHSNFNRSLTNNNYQNNNQARNQPFRKSFTQNKEKECYKCKKPWIPGHTCAIPQQTGNPQHPTSQNKRPENRFENRRRTYTTHSQSIHNQHCYSQKQ